MSAYLNLNEAAQKIPGRPHLSTLHRWAEKGVRGIRLRTVRVGHRRFTTQDDIDQFLAKLNESTDQQLAREGC